MTCAIDDCDLDVRAHGWCVKHYTRFKRHGNPLVTMNNMTPVACSIDGCETRAVAKGMCGMHRRRVLRRGDPAIGMGDYWLKEVVTYGSAHKRIYDAKGPAADWWCEHCDNRAATWAYDGKDPDARAQESGPKAGYVYSLDPDHYFPLCRSCHSIFDGSTNKARTVRWERYRLARACELKHSSE